MKKIICFGMLCAVLCSGAAAAAEITATSITGLASLDSGCSEHTETLSAVGVQFSKSGMTLELIQFLNKDKSVFAMPTDFETAGLSTLQQSEANDFIKLGSFYKVHYQLCGQGGYPSLMDIHVAK